MSRVITVAAAQLGPIQNSDSRSDAVARMEALLTRAAGMGADLVVFPELALTTFFPRWHFEDSDDLDRYFETAMPNPEVQPLFDRARALDVGFYLGYAELVRQDDGRRRRFNTAILVGPDGSIIGKYRKIHLPGHAEPEPWRAFQHLEKRYFEVGDLGFPVWRAWNGVIGMCLCNDRRWPETYRMMGLQGVELICLGYNTPVHNPPAPEQDALTNFHNQLVMQSGAYQNGTFVVGTAKAGREEGCDLGGQSSIIAPSGEILAQCVTLGDEIALARCDLDLCHGYKSTIFNFDRHRQPDQYGLITRQRGARPPS